MKDFVHLHVHSEYSLLDGYATTKAITKHAADLGMDSIALTDHGVMYGAIEFNDAAKKAGIKPIIGVEAYMAVGNHQERSPNKRSPSGKQSYHILLLAQNMQGYRNLVKLTTRAHLNGFYYKPRIDHDLLEQHREGLIVTSACIAGEINDHLRSGMKDEARKIAAWHRDVLGPDNYYLELQLHPGVPELEQLNDELVRIGKELNIPLVVANDAHFVHQHDAEAHRLVRALGFNTTLPELCQKEPTLDDSYYIKTGEEMWDLFKRYGTAPLENTRAIADRCNLDLDFGRVELPQFEIPEGHTASSYLRLVCEQGLMRHFNGHPTEEYMKRLDYELDVINQTGFPDYMLIVWDYVKFARSRNIPCLPRGSAGASLVLYCLGITDVDPVENKLLFERFLSPERLEMPDIDTDFADSRRHEVIDYIANKYGRENTAQIITYGTMGAKNALRDAGRVLDIPLSEVDRVAKLIPALPVGVTISQALERVPELKQIHDTSTDLKKVIDMAQHIEGRMRNVGTHACGLVVSRTPLDETVPLQRTTKDEQSFMAAYEGPTLAKVGLLKMDILGLTNLSVVAEALDYIEKTTGKRMELADIPLDDAKTFESLSNGETTNVFQFESAGMTRYMKELKPTRVEDLYAMVALYRPGPLEQIPVYIRNKNNPRNITYLHPILEPILKDTYGVIVYQEQIMQLLQAIAGYTLGRAYIVLKAIGKKKRDLMAQEEPRFKEGCIKNGLTPDQANQLWDLIQPFAGYSFNRPHSTLYGLLSYQTAYLKVNYPTEYLAAVLSAAAGDIEEVAKGVAECSRLGVAVLPADINRSHQGFTIEQVAPDMNSLPEGVRYMRGIRFGLSAIKNVGVGPVQAIIASREEGGPFASLEDVCSRVDRQAMNKRVLESLVKAGALDNLAGTRRQKLAVLDQVISAGLEMQKARDVGQVSMFDMFGGDSSGGEQAAMPAIVFPTINESPEDKKEQLAWEKELIGMYISEHPVAQALQGIDVAGTTRLGQLNEEIVGQAVTIIGMVTGTRRISTKKGDAMLVASLEDLDGIIEMVVFPRTLTKYGDLLLDDAVLRITGKVDDRRGSLQIVVEKCEPVEAAATVSPDTSDAHVQPEMDIEGLSGDEESNGVQAEHAALPAHQNGASSQPDVQKTEYTASSAASSHIRQESESYTPAVTPATPPAAATLAPPANTPPTPPAEPQTFIRARTKVSLAGNGSNGNGSNGNNGNGSNGNNGNGLNGNNGGNGSNGYGAGASQGASPAESTSIPSRISLKLHLIRTDDFDADVSHMQDVDKVLRASKGNDQVVLFVPNNGGVVALCPQYRIQVTENMLGQLCDLLGTERVVPV